MILHAHVFIGDEIVDNNSGGVRQSAKIVFDEDFLAPHLRCGKKSSTARLLDDRTTEAGQSDKQEGKFSTLLEYSDAVLRHHLS
jgi:hypothetical protein